MKLLNEHTFSKDVRLYTTDTHVFIGIENGLIEVYDAAGSHSRTLKGQSGAVWALTSISNWLISGGTDTTVQVCEITTGACLHELSGHTSTVRCLETVDPDTFISAGRDATLRVWDIQTDACKRVLEGHSATIREIAVKNDYVVSGSYDHRAYNIYAVIILDSDKVATGSLDDTVIVWNLKTGNALASLNAHRSLVVQLHPVESNLLTADASGEIKLWNINSYREIYADDAARGNSIVSLKVVDTKIVNAAGSVGQLRDVQSGKVIETFQDKADAIWGMDMVGGKVLAVALSRDNMGVVEFWEGI